jgi:divalent metal cation (Fe/Co/Zn/Cd) transporter
VPPRLSGWPLARLETMSDPVRWLTTVDGILAVAVPAGLLLNTVAGWWWADPAAGYVLVYYAVRESRDIFSAKDE